MEVQVIVGTLLIIFILILAGYFSTHNSKLIASCEASYNCSPGRTIELIGTIFGNTKKYLRGSSITYVWKGENCSIEITIKEETALIRFFDIKEVSKDDSKELCSFFSKILELTIE
jgi:hypothetical protein